MLQDIAAWVAVAVSFATLLWTIYYTRRKADSEVIGKIFQRLDLNDNRITRVETEMRHLPDKDSAHRIEMSLEMLRGQVATLAAETRGSVEALTERVGPISEVSKRLQEFLLEQAERR